MPNSKRERKRTPGTKYFGFSANKALSDRIIGLSKERFRSLSAIIRMLLWLGLEQYDINAKSGNDTAIKRQQDAALRKAESEAKAAERERRKNGEYVTDVTKPATPLLFGTNAENK